MFENGILARLYAGKQRNYEWLTLGNGKGNAVKNGGLRAIIASWGDESE